MNRVIWCLPCERKSKDTWNDMFKHLVCEILIFSKFRLKFSACHFFLKSHKIPKSGSFWSWIEFCDVTTWKRIKRYVKWHVQTSDLWNFDFSKFRLKIFQHVIFFWKSDEIPEFESCWSRMELSVMSSTWKMIKRYVEWHVQTSSLWNFDFQN